MSVQLGGAWPGVVETVQVVALVGTGLLVPAGLAKLRRPVDAADALGWRHPFGRAAVRVVGAGELALAAGVLLLDGRFGAALLALAYLAFAGVAWRQRRRGASCGCFGQAEAPAGLLHVVVDLAVAVAAGTAALGAVPLSVGGHLDALGVGTAALAALVVAVAVATVQQLLTGLPDLRAATRRVTLPAPRTAPSGGAGSGGVR